MASLEEYLILFNANNSSDEEVEQAEENVLAPLGRRTLLAQSGDEAFLESGPKLKKNYRLTKDLCRELIENLRPYLRCAQRPSDLNVEMKILIALNFFATGSYQIPIGLYLTKKNSQSSVSKCVTEVVTALNNPNIFKEYVIYPSTFEELDQITQQFYHMYGLPGVVGIIDCTHVAIFPPNAEEYNERAYVNRKGQHTINTQFVGIIFYICDSNMCITNVNALFPGSTHDSYIWNQSAVLPLMQALYSNGHIGYYLMGDSGYALRPWLHVPVTEPEEGTPGFRYNRTFKTVRATIERCNGLLKGRFRCLRKERGLHYSSEKATKIINSCVVLHNLCVTNNVLLKEEEDEDGFPTDLRLELPPPPQPRGRANQDLLRGQAMPNCIINRYF